MNEKITCTIPSSNFGRAQGGKKLNVTVDYLIGHTNLREPLPPIDDELYFEIKRIKNTRVKRAVLTLLKEMEEPDAPASLVKPY